MLNNFSFALIKIIPFAIGKVEPPVIANILSCIFLNIFTLTIYHIQHATENVVHLSRPVSVLVTVRWDDNLVFL